MNAHAHLSGHISGQVPNQPSLMHNFGGHNLDPDLSAKRRSVHAHLLGWLQRRNSDVNANFASLASKFEDWLFKSAASKEDYMNMGGHAIEHRIQNFIKSANNSQLNAHRLSSSSAVSTMIPTPGMAQTSSTNSVVWPADNSIISTSGAAMVVPTTVNTGSIQPVASGVGSVGTAATSNVSDGQVPNGYRKVLVNSHFGSGGNTIMSQQPTQMIPTPGLNNFQPVTAHPEFSSGGGFLSNESSVSLQPQLKQYVGSQTGRNFHSPLAQVGIRMRSNMYQKPPTYEFPNGIMNSSLGLSGTNLQVVNGSTTSDGYLSAVAYGTPERLQEHFDQQQHQTMLPTSLPQQVTSTPGDVYGMGAVDPLGPGNLYGSSVASVFNHQNVNPASLQSKSKTSFAMQSQNAGLQSIQQVAKPQIPDQSQKMNPQISHSTGEQLLSSQNQLQKFQHQQFQQQPSQSYTHPIQHQQEQLGQQQQQFMSKADSLKHSSMISNFGRQLTPGCTNDLHQELLPNQPAEHFHLSKFQNQCEQRTPSSNQFGGSQLLGHLSSTHDSPQPVPQDPQQVSESQNDVHCLSTGSQPDVPSQNHWRPQLLQKSHILDLSPLEQQIKEEFNQRITGRDEAQQSHISWDGCSTASGGGTKGVATPQRSGKVAPGPGSMKRERDFHNQRRWLLLLLHARSCRTPKGECQEVCSKAQKLCAHMRRCKSSECKVAYCESTKKIYGHFISCRCADCPVCVPVHDFIARERARPNCNSAEQMTDSKRMDNSGDADRISIINVPPVETSTDLQALPKRMKVEHDSQSLVPKQETTPVPVQLVNHSHDSPETQFQGCEAPNTSLSIKSEISEMKLDTPTSPGCDNAPIFNNLTDGFLENAHRTRPDLKHDLKSVGPVNLDDHGRRETILEGKEPDQAKIETNNHEPNAQPNDTAAGNKSGKPKIKGVSLTELFTPEQVREHIVSLRRWVGQSKAKAEKNQAMEHSMSDNACQLCAVEKLTFEPPPIYCSPCGARIKRNAMYYTVGTGDTRHCFCTLCYNEARGDTIEVDGSTFPKIRLEKKKNDEETEEWWVQCDKCEAWQHQICALFNGRRNDGGQAEYTCPNCYIDEVDRGERMPLPQSSVLGAKDLPRTLLSDHIEQRLFRRLKQERQERARNLGKSYDEVPGAEALVVRVVSSVDKKLEVKQRFLEIFQEENYPTEFPYKSKVILLFQRIEGVEVCLFGMYVQEFGSECQFPNQRRVYLSYLDSVKYFRPEIKTVTGEALRTFVYHEILIGYLEYCKRRGFTSCYIWACPPLKGEDYILYCHPEIQKTPKSDKLREWYLSMLRKATKENIVADLTNLYDHFFVHVGECKAKITAARLPYFDGDYWPGAAEDMINQLRQEEDGRKQQKKGKIKKLISKRALKAAGHADLSGNASKDALLMQKLGETIHPMKEDFIMVHLQHACTHCCLLMVSGIRWVCNQCKSFQLCDKCHDTEQRLEERDRHPINSREKHMLCPVEINDVPLDTKDKDEILESEFFDTRQAFLSLCQGNHYQYDTLRRAKHSSMMVLYHLHNPTAPAFVTTCNICHHDIETGQGWRCEICPDFDVCNACYQKDGGPDHPHKLTNHPSLAERDAQNKEARQKRVLQLRKMLDLLVHASQCRSPHCQYPNCRKVKGLFRHGMQCKTRASGGCPLCRKMWYLLQLHARACKVSECHVPRCKDLKEHLKRLQQQSDSRRRAAVMEMMRQRAAEVAGNAE
ncbi:putative histone acetyltransferase chromatin regulator PHD family [Dioscorea sansibarensis]